MGKYPCVYMRGGTSKAVFFHKKDLPENQELWNDLFLKVMGTPDPKQIDGMGGTYPVTSKVAVIAPSDREGIDVDYTFYQIGIDTPVVESHANCGNVSSAVGPFAVDEGLVKVTEPVTVVRIWNTNTEKVIEEHVWVENGKAMTRGNQAIPGVPKTGAPIDVYFERPGGAVTGSLFPSHHKRDVLRIPGYNPVTVTMIDCSNPIVFIRAEDLGIQGTELSELGENRQVMTQVEAIRQKAAEYFGFPPETLSVPKVSVISSPQDYVSSEGTIVKAQEMDLCARVITVRKFHKTHPITVGIGTAAAACIPGTIVHEASFRVPGTIVHEASFRVPGTIVHEASSCIPGTMEHEAAAAAGQGGMVRIGHPSGILEIKIDMDGEEVAKGGVVRTARRIMDGMVYVEEDDFMKGEPGANLN